MKKHILPVTLGLFGLMSGPLLAQDATTAAADAVTYATASDISYILNTLLFLIGGFLVMWMAAGFAMLEAGLVRTKNVSMQCLKNISLFSVAGIMFWLPSCPIGLMPIGISSL